MVRLGTMMDSSTPGSRATGRTTPIFGGKAPPLRRLHGPLKVPAHRGPRPAPSHGGDGRVAAAGTELTCDDGGGGTVRPRAQHHPGPASHRPGPFPAHHAPSGPPRRPPQRRHTTTVSAAPANGRDPDQAGTTAARPHHRVTAFTASPPSPRHGRAAPTRTAPHRTAAPFDRDVPSPPAPAPSRAGRAGRRKGRVVAHRACRRYGVGPRSAIPSRAPRPGRAHRHGRRRGAAHRRRVARGGPSHRAPGRCRRAPAGTVEP